MGFDVFVESNADPSYLLILIIKKWANFQEVSELYKNADLIVKVQRPQNLKNLMNLNI